MNHLSDLAAQLRRVAEEYEPATVAEKVLAAAAAMDSLPCEHEPVDPANASWGRCKHCRVDLRRVWIVDPNPS